jgi:hypothetical protein
LDAGLHSNYIFDLPSAPTHFLDAIPVDYSRALMRASRTHGKDGVFHRDNAVAIANEMARILERCVFRCVLCTRAGLAC